jgi:hypothetical protein
MCPERVVVVVQLGGCGVTTYNLHADGVAQACAVFNGGVW